MVPLSGMVAAVEEHLWWQTPPNHRSIRSPDSVYGPIFGPFPTAQLTGAILRDLTFLSSTPTCGAQARCAEVRPAETVRNSRIGPKWSALAEMASPSPSPSSDGKESAAVDPEERTTLSTEDFYRIETRIDGEANLQWRDDGVDEDFPPVDVELLRAVWQRYIVNDGDSACSGTTLMCHDLLNKFTVEPDLLNLFEKVGLLDDVVYVYLPLTYLKSSQTYKLKRPSRNKGYGFVHFSSNDAATRFAQLIRQVDLVGTGRGVKQMYTTPAKFQGVGANLVELLDLENEQWRPKQGCFYVRLEPGGPLNCLGISPVRSFVQAQMHFAN